MVSIRADSFLLLTPKANHGGPIIFRSAKEMHRKRRYYHYPTYIGAIGVMDNKMTWEAISSHHVVLPRKMALALWLAYQQQREKDG